MNKLTFITSLFALALIFSFHTNIAVISTRKAGELEIEYKAANKERKLEIIHILQENGYRNVANRLTIPIQEQELKELRTITQQLAGEIKKSSPESATVEKKIGNALAEQLAESERKIALMQDENDKLKLVVRQFAKDNEQLKENNQKLENKLQETMGHEQQKMWPSEDLERERKENQIRVSKLQQQLTSCHHEKETLNNKLSDIQIQLRTTKESLTNALSEAKKAAIAAEQSVKAELSPQMANCQERIERALQEERILSAQQVTHLKKDNEFLEKELQKQSEKASQIESELNEVRQKLAVGESQKIKAAEIQREKERANKADEMVTKLQKEVMTANQAQQVAQQEAKLASQNAQKDAEERYKTILANNRENVDRAIQAQQAAEMKAKAAQAEIFQLKQQLESAVQEKSKSDTLLKNLSEQINTLTSKLDAALKKAVAQEQKIAAESAQTHFQALDLPIGGM